MKTKEELILLKEEVEALNKKLHELTEEELAQVTGGIKMPDDFENVNDLLQYEAYKAESQVMENQQAAMECQQTGLDLDKNEIPKIESHIIKLKPHEYRNNPN